MKKNITLSADERLIENARKIARSENKTLNAVFREWLEAYQARSTTAVSYRQLMAALDHVKSGRKFSRDEMNER
jgi:hypothetical protein